MKNTAISFGLLLAALVTVLKLVEYQFLMRTYSTEWYILFIAVIFTAIGIWTGLKLTRRTQEITEFKKNTKALDALGISERELEVLELVAEGKSNQQVADQLFISVNTVKTHLSRVYEKLDVKRRTQAVEKARALNLIP